jgi:hypothetical protein
MGRTQIIDTYRIRESAGVICRINHHLFQQNQIETDDFFLNLSNYTHFLGSCNQDID